MEEDWERFIQVQLRGEAVNIAKKLAKDLALRGADAVYLASALLLQRRFVEIDDRLILVTSDHELRDGAQSSGLIVIDPEDED